MDQAKTLVATFYSYKGGVGRSMAVANVAWLLATKYGKKVLVVDWDLEAPGLHRFFDLPETRIKAGLIDMLYDYKKLLQEELSSLPDKVIDIKNYITPIDIGVSAGSISMIAAGRPGPDYANRINEFSWEEFYRKWHGFRFVEYLKDQLRREAQVSLIDSRTGVTDIGGICTLQLPDTVVLLFALNEQNIAGIESVAESILQKATEVAKRTTPPALILRPSRVDKISEEDKKIKLEEMAATRLGGYLSSAERTQDPLIFMKKKSIPYVASYSFGETPLAVQKDPHGDLATSFDEIVTSLLQSGDIGLSQVQTTAGRRRFLSLRRRVLSWSMTPTAIFAVVLLTLILTGGAFGLRHVQTLNRQLGEEKTDRERLLTDNARLLDENGVLKSRDYAARDAKRRQLAKSLFSNDPGERIGAGAEIVSGWRTDEELVPILVGTALDNLQNGDGIYNTVVMLNRLDIDSLRPHKRLVIRFLDTLKADPASKTQAEAGLLRKSIEIGYSLR